VNTNRTRKCVKLCCTGISIFVIIIIIIIIIGLPGGGAEEEALASQECAFELLHLMYDLETKDTVQGILEACGGNGEVARRAAGAMRAVSASTNQARATRGAAFNCYVALLIRTQTKVCYIQYSIMMCHLTSISCGVYWRLV
jgi:hypothetical protein